MMTKRGAAFLIIGVVACGAAEIKKPTHAGVIPRETDAGAPWQGDGCTTLASRSAPLDVPNAVLDGDLYKGQQHCYLDLQRALCVRFADAGDADVDEVYVRSLRLGGTCESRHEVRFRGSLRGVVEPLTPHSTTDFAVDANATSIEHAEHTVDVELSDASAARMELLKSFMVHCWRNATFASPTMTGHLTLDVAVSPTGEVTDVHRKDAVAAPDAFEACVVKALRAPQMFVDTDAGAARALSLRVTFSVAVSALQSK